MNAITRPTMPIIACVLLLGLFAATPSASAESSDHCINVKGSFLEHFGSGSNPGTMANGGILNGTTERVFNSASLPTPDPTAISFTSDYVVTTRRGVLKTHVVYIYDFLRAVAAAIHRIDPDASSGVFAGATGVLYENARLNFQTSTAEGNVSGEIFFTKKREID